ncbi:MAG: hypothetical protein KJZ55_04860, partial [Flavobacteriales bacterium]|nr:hypothetical protein [Flavobacteriales bacterium]
MIRQKQLLDPAFKLQEQENELKIKNFVPLTNITGKTGNVLTIPVVVHVLHKGEPLGTGTNISDAQIQSAIDRLNVVYRGLDPNSPIDFEIEFSLAKRDPNCNTTSGINRLDARGVSGYTANGVLLESIGADENALKDLSRWPETDYFNIWIVSEIDGNNGGFGIQGYANFYNGNQYEGSVMMASVFGYDLGNTNGWNLNSNGDGSTVIHEFGHYFHLYHTFQGDNDNANCPADLVVGDDSDGCADTEIHKRLTSTCPTNNTCNGNNPYGLNTRNNYMSYFSCTDRLTNDQKTRVTAAMSGTSIVASKGAIDPDPGYSNPIATNCSPVTGPTGLSGGYAGIMNFSVENDATFTSSNAGDDGGYVDFTTSCNNFITVDENSTKNISVTTWYNAQNIKGYIDFNNDGDFDDAGEQVFSTSTPANTNPPYTSTANTSITIPVVNGSTVVGNTYMRMRVITD